MRILVIDDDEELSCDIKQVLGENGHVAECVHDGASSEEFTRLNRFGLVILNVILPNKSGIDVCRALRGKGMNTPIP